jgi:hypothetical protein
VGNPKVRIVRGETVRIETFAPQDALPIEADGNVRGGYRPCSFEFFRRVAICKLRASADYADFFGTRMTKPTFKEICVICGCSFFDIF